MKHVKRSIEKVVTQASASFKCLLLCGPRQVGKTTLLESIAEVNRKRVTLDDPQLRSLAKSDPALFLSSYPPPVLIDEVQYAPELFPYIKMRVDRSSQTGQYWLTGSQPFHLMKNVSESLAGRVAILTLQGLSTAEIAARTEVPFVPRMEQPSPGSILTRAEVAEKIFRGSFPQLEAIPETDVTLYMRSYVATYLERDIRELVKAEHEHEFATFLSCLAARTGQLLNASNIAQDVGISPTTIRSWISILESSGVILALHPYRTNLTKRATATPKLYFTDTGLATHLCGIRSPEELERSSIFGHLFENMAVISILKSWWNSGLDCQASFYRDREGHEIDMLIQDGQRLHPIEIKSSAAPDAESIMNNISALSRTGTRLSLGAAICLTPENRPLNEALNAVNIGNIGIL